jgi:hypothetical protein
MKLDDDLQSMSNAELVTEIQRLRKGIRTHRDARGHDLCWFHPELWNLLPEQGSSPLEVPAWPEFMEGCVKYRQSLEDIAFDGPDPVAG